MELTPKRRRIVQQEDWGVYVWRLPGGKYLSDDDGNFMLIASMRGDKEKMKMLADAARYYGYAEGKAEFWAGRRPIDDEEYEKQLARQKLGLIPDPLDPGVYRDSLKGENQ